MKLHNILRKILSASAMDIERQSIVGDFEEEYEQILSSKGKLAALRWYFLQVIISIPKFLKTITINNFSMAGSYIKIAKRNMVRNKLSSVINIFGFSTALSICIFGYVFVTNIRNSDMFHEKYDKIYQTVSYNDTNEGIKLTGVSPLPLGETLSREFPQIDNFTRYSYIGTTVESRGRNFEESIIIADKSFFDIFTFPFVSGGKANLERNDWVAISEEYSTKYFGSADPLGKKITVNFPNGETSHYSVAGVIKKFTLFSSIRPNIIIPFDSYINADELGDWKKTIRATFFEINDPKNAESINHSLEKYTDLINISDTERKLNKLALIPLPEIQNTGLNIKTTVIYPIPLEGYVGSLVISFLLLISAILNYINISLAGVTKRMKEIGLRKVVGANRKQLIAQFISENMLLIAFSMIFAFIMCEFFFLPGFEALSGLGITSIFDSDLTDVVVYMIALMLVTGLAAGLYPSIAASSFSPVQIFRQGHGKKGRNILARISLVFQFILATLIVFGSIVSLENTSYQNNIDWGYDQEQIIVIPIENSQEYELLKNQIQSIESIIGITGSVNNIGMGSNVKIDLKYDDQNYRVAKYTVGADYINTIGMDLVQGRGFDKNLISDIENSILINETFVNNMQWSEPVGKQVYMGSKQMEIVGVVDDFHYEDFSQRIGPVVLLLAGIDDFNFMTVKIKSGKVQVTHDLIKDTWEKVIPDVEFEAIIQDQVFKDFLRQRTADYKTFMTLAFIILTTTCMGLLGLMSINLNKREKEISIRKVLGASESKLFFMLNVDFIIMLVIAFIIATPLANFLFTQFLGLFPYHVEITSSMFVITYVLITITTATIIIKQIFNAITANPAEILGRD